MRIASSTCALVQIFLCCALSTQSVEAYEVDDQDYTKILDITKKEFVAGDLNNNVLVQIVAKAETVSPRLIVFNAEINAASEDVAATKGALKPQITTRAAINQAAIDYTPDQRNTLTPTLTVTANYNLYDWGRLENLVAARQAILERNEQSYRDLRNQIAIESVTHCLNYRNTAVLLKAARMYSDKVKSLNTILEKITEIDPGRASEFNQARSRQLQAEATTVTYKQRLAELSSESRRLFGDEEEVKRICAGVEISLAGNIATAQEIQVNYERNPAIAITKKDYDQSRYQTASVAAAIKPQITLSASNAPSQPLDPRTYSQLVSVVGTVPLYDGGTLRSAEKAALQRETSSFNRYQDKILTITRDYQKAKETLRFSYELARNYRSLLDVNEQVRSDAFIQWSTLGRRTMFELLLYEQEHFSLVTNYINNLYKAYEATAFLLGNENKLSP